MKRTLNGLSIGVASLALVVLVGCGGLETSPVTDDDLKNSEELRRDNAGKIFGDDALTFGPGVDKGNVDPGGSGIGVNSFLWRASLDTISFMPLTQADPFGGVIITDWYTPEESPGERYKLNVYILDRQLRADGLRVAVFKQRRTPAGTWQDVNVPGDAATKLEDAILTRARQMRIDVAAEQ